MLLIGFSFIARAQQPADYSAPKMPIDEESKLFSYKKTNEVAGVSKNDLYNRAFAWANAYYKNPTDVIREKDMEKGKLVCKARYKIYNIPDKKGFSSDVGDVMYTLTIDLKDGKYRYEITNINLKGISYFAAEKWLDTKNQYYNNNWDYFLKQVDDNSKKIIADLEKSMATAPKVKKDDW